jgi:hypothetical protein
MLMEFVEIEHLGILISVFLFIPDRHCNLLSACNISLLRFEAKIKKRIALEFSDPCVSHIIGISGSLNCRHGRKHLKFLEVSLIYC